MGDVVVVLVLVVVVAAAFAVRRRQVADRSAAATTVELSIDRDGVRRTLADGRSESATWSALQSVEVVCTPVRTADGVKAFVLLAEGPEAGCLVPLGVGHDDALLVELGRLPRFRTEAFVDAQQHKPPHRTMVWTRDAVL